MLSINNHKHTKSVKEGNLYGTVYGNLTRHVRNNDDANRSIRC